jgi:hypothetical protein
MNEPTRAPSYRHTVRWIATRSGAEKLGYPDLLSLSAVQLTSEQFGLDAYDVAADVAREIEVSAGPRP